MDMNVPRQTLWPLCRKGLPIRVLKRKINGYVPSNFHAAIGRLPTPDLVYQYVVV